MKHLIWLLLLIFTLSSPLSFSQNKSLIEILNDQVDAFNKRDVTRLVNNITEDFKWYSLTTDELLVETSNKKSFQQGMVKYYQARPHKITAKILSYTIDGSRISFKEVVSHKNKKGEVISSSAMGIYQIKKGKIFRAWYFID